MLWPAAPGPRQRSRPTCVLEEVGCQEPGKDPLPAQLEPEAELTLSNWECGRADPGR